MSDPFDCNEVDELAGALALGATGAEEDAALRAHMTNCDQPHFEVHEALGAGLVLATSLDPVAPRPILRDRVMATIERTPQAHRPAVDTTPQAVQRGWLDRLSVGVARPLALAAAVALLAVGVWNVSLQSQLAQRDAVLRAVAGAIAGSDTAFRVDGSAGRGYVVDAPGAGAALIVGDLASLPANSLYELWLIDASGTAVAVGALEMTEGALAVIPVERDLTGYATFAVTIEAERVTAPTGAPVMIGDLEAPS